MFCTRLGLSSYLQAAHPDVAQGGGDPNEKPNPKSKQKPKPRIVGALYLNFSFSTELASIYDMTRDTLLDLAGWLRVIYDPMNRGLLKRLRAEGIPVFDRKKIENLVLPAVWGDDWGKQLAVGIHQVCEQFPDLKNPPRTALDLVKFLKEHSDWISQFKRDHERLSRLSFLGRLMREFKMASDAIAVSDINIRPRILVCLNACELVFNEQRMPKNMEIAEILVWLGSDKAGRFPIDIIAIGSPTKMGIPWIVKTGQNDAWDAFIKPVKLDHRLITRKTIRANGQAVVKIRKTKSGIDFANAIAGPNGVHRFNHVHFARVMNPTRLLVDNFLPLAAIFFEASKERKTENPATQTAARAYLDLQNTYKAEALAKWGEHHLPEADKHLRKIKHARDEEIEEVLLNAHRTYLEKGNPGSIREALFQRYKEGETDYKEWRNISRALTGNRYCLTILLAAAQTVALAEDDWMRGSEKAHRYIRDTIEKVRSVSRVLREEIVLQSALDVYRRLSVVRVFGSRGCVI